MLSTTQDQFVDALFSKENPNLHFIISKNKGERIKIYKENVFENLRNALEITFPGIWKLIGKDCADKVAYLYCLDKNNLPLSGCLDDWGEGFISFLRSISSLQALTYLSDYAEYEWKKHLCSISEKRKSVDLSKISFFSEEELEQLCFKLQPSMQLIHSLYPLAAIENLLNDPSLPNIDLNSANSWGCILFFNDQIETFWFEKEEWEFIHYLYKGLTLGEAYKKLENVLKTNELTKMINFLFSTKSICSYSMGKNHANQNDYTP